MEKQFYAKLEFPKHADRPYVVINMISTADGKATMAGVAHTIGDRYDHEMMQQLRVGADAIMSGSGTLVKEDIIPSLDEEYQKLRQEAGKPPFPMALTLTGRPDLPFNKAFFTPENRPHVYFTGTEAGKLAEHAGLTSIVSKDPIPELLHHAKRELHVDLLILEGGPTLNHSFLEVGCADELFLTLAPRISGESGISIVEGKSALDMPLELVSQIQINNELFLRYKIGRKNR